jgi:hypothetical protein
MHILAHVLGGLAAVAGFSAIVMLLWNAIIPSLFGIAGINFCQALGLLALCRILFGSFGGAMGGFRHGMGAHLHHNSIREKWQKMLPEERKEFIRHHRHSAHSSGHFDSDLSCKHKEEEPGKKD